MVRRLLGVAAVLVRLPKLCALLESTTILTCLGGGSTLALYRCRGSRAGPVEFFSLHARG